MEVTKERYAIVTGSNKGIGLATVKQLASHGIKVLLTARDSKRGFEALQELKHSGISHDLVSCHQLDVTDSASIASLVDFVRIQFGRLDILVNNAAILGVIMDEPVGSTINPAELIQTDELAEKCLKTNYYGAKETTEAFLPLLQLSDSPTIVNVSSQAGSLNGISNKCAKEVLDDAENLTDYRIDEVLREFKKDFKEGCLESKGWPMYGSAYKVAKAALNAYTRLVAIKYPNVCVNCVCPGSVITDLTRKTGSLSVEQGAYSVVKLALLPPGSPSGLFYVRQHVSTF
ncbi:(+)-neomenthol dehydrogenase-like [Prosopis cineraria]|uniref:(+)-neomenthol dehydrogenase-like n=1 Tax=Prosopis cineraria TaxID=364024 RepID=UPI00240F0DCF|nr:(+)-neomenthol dehydrogenase-like [Prosopis cineraria]XP_054779521.1 (+)-neomenthol dehydrogenase-like [Prosopis cineraria]